MAVKSPQDRRPRAVKRKPKKYVNRADDGTESMQDFVYTAVDGTEFVITAEDLGDVLNPGFVRRNRKEPQEEVAFLLIEGLERDDLLDLLDHSWADYRRFSEEFADYVNETMELSMGESLAS